MLLHLDCAEPPNYYGLIHRGCFRLSTIIEQVRTSNHLCLQQLTIVAESSGLPLKQGNIRLFLYFVINFEDKYFKADIFTLEQ